MFEEQLGVDEQETNESTFLNADIQASSTGEDRLVSESEFIDIVKFDYDNTPIVDIVNDMIVDSVKRGVSDIHFDPFESGIHIRIRIDGDLHNYTTVPLTMKKNMITRVKIISNMNITESRLPQDGAIKGLIEDMNVDLRVSCLPTNMGEKIVIRILDYSMSSAGLENLGFTKENYETVKKMIAIPNGIILVTGATGSGKSTTVYAMLQRLNTERRNLITVEDPIEMNIEGINQVQVNSDIGMTFGSALRSILRQDPDIIMIGEIRDTETARIAVRSAITGHLVLSTIHTNDSLNTIERLLDMDVERYLLGAAISGIISQKLARHLCDKCKHLRPTTDYEKTIFKSSLGLDVGEIYEAKGCPECSGGYKGRLPIHEVLLINQDIKDAISSGMSKSKLRELVFAENSDITTMLQDGLRKVLTGETSIDEILRLIQLDDEHMNSYKLLVLDNTKKEAEEIEKEEQKSELEQFSI
ncbi:MAG TPA: type II secretion system protein GspE [Firmicutes bacterium]|nr:type II secretion system protein GspE [Bacillota bacterium]